MKCHDLPIGRNSDESKFLVKAFQNTDEHGEVCSVGCYPGDKAMISDSKKNSEKKLLVSQNDESLMMLVF